MDEAKWYVAHTFSGYENKVASNIQTVVENRNLHDLIQEVSVPTETVVEIKDDGTKKEVERKIFPGYVLVKMILNDKSWYIVRNTRGCTGFVGQSTKPLPLSPEEVKKLGVETENVELAYNVGDVVSIIDGPLANMTGTVTSINKKTKKAYVNVSMFGRETPAELELIQLKPVM